MNYEKGMYVFSGKGLGLGNFINLTPMLKSLSDHWKRPVPVYIEPDHVRECFLDCPFIELLKHPDINMVFHSRMYIMQGTYTMPDYEYLWLLGKAKFGYADNMPHTYIDEPYNPYLDNHNLIAFVNGAGAWKQDYLDKKIIDDEIYQQISDFVGERVKVVLGSEKCNNPLAIDECLDQRSHPIRYQLTTLRSASMLITNEGGLAHSAAAMNKPVFVMWKDTDKIKNKNPGKHTFYSYDNHLQNFKEFYKLHKK